MLATLRAIAADLEVRCDAIEAAVSASTQPELGYQREQALMTSATVRRRGRTAVEGTERAGPDQYGPQLRRLQALSTMLDRIEWYVLPCLERFGKSDAEQTRILRALLEEAGWKEWSPAVLTWAMRYFSASPTVRVISVCAGEERKLLRLPDVAHEFGHCLYVARGDELTQSLLVDLFLWAAGASSEAEHKRRDVVLTRWSEAWLAEFTCDAIGTVLTGPAYGKQHIMLCSRLNLDPYRSLPSHPADHARATVIRHTLIAMGLEAEAEAFWAAWTALCAALEQPIAEGAPGRPAVMGKDFWRPYPSDENGERFVEKVARLTLHCCERLGITPYRPGRPAGASVTGLLDEAWSRYESDPASYGAMEAGLVAKLLARVS